MLSVALLLGFYLLGVLVLAASVGAIWLMLAAGYINVGVVLAAPAVAFAVLRGMLTAGHKFKGLPGSVQVTPQTQPELFGEITDIADRMGADAPDEVYLVHDVNAFVLEDTRLLGLVTRKRVMGIGLPLIDSLSVDELRGVIAHEFGHYAGGDTRLAPVVYRGRTSILQTIRSLGGGFVASIYVQYFKVFLRTSMAVSRRQELAADAWAVTVAGTGPTVATNQRLGALGAANDAFLDQYVHSLWIEGRRPVNQFSGFRRMVGHADNADAFRDAAEAVLRRTADAYDSHPSSSERIAFVRELPHVADPGDDRPARALLHDLESLEVELTAAYASVTWLGGALTPVGWDDAGSVYAERLLPISDALMSTTRSDNRVDAISSLVGRSAPDRAMLGIRMRNEHHLRGDASSTVNVSLAASLALTLVQAGTHRWVVSWTTPVSVEPIGSARAVDVWTLADRVGADDPDAVAELDALLATSGASAGPAEVAHAPALDSCSGTESNSSALTPWAPPSPTPPVH